VIGKLTWKRNPDAKTLSFILYKALGVVSNKSKKIESQT
jgi:hypothetical protein